MVNQQPILIAGPPRSGTTLLAGLLAKHGIWIGRGRTTNYPGTNPEFVSENQDIKKIFKQAAKAEGYTNWQVPVPYLYGKALEQNDIEQYVPDGKRWLLKTSWNLIFSRSLIEFYPEALWVLPWRDRELIFDSMNRHPGMARRQDSVKKKFIRDLQSKQKMIAATDRNSIFVDISKLAQISSSELVKLFGFVGIRPDWKTIEEWIQPERMRV
jgi:hypothetical protein